eukprot:356690-Chlamydomonas_euryale.AAC.9
MKLEEWTKELLTHPLCELVMVGDAKSVGTLLYCSSQHTAAATSKQPYQRWYGCLLVAAAVC